MSARDFTLVALATGYPSPELREVVGALGPELRQHPALGPMVRCLDDGLEPLRAEYLAVFEAGKDRAPPYETEYGRMRGLAKGKDLADLMGFYAAFGLELDDVGELGDHIAVELEFYALLLHKQDLLQADPVGTDVVRDARGKFLTDHLGSFPAALATRPSVLASPIYGPLLAWVAALLAEECDRLGVRPAPLDFFASEEGEVTCGGCVTLPKPPGSAEADAP